MKILITGHNGFIGKNLKKRLEKNHEVDGYEYDSKLKIYNMPIVSGYDWVIHLGAISSTAEKDVDKVMLQNYEFSKWIFKECCAHNVNLQYSSSASVYGLSTNFHEDSPKQPMSPYAWSKYLFDRWASNKDKNILVQGFRYFNVYGPDEEHKGDQASPYTKFIKQAKEFGEISLFEGSENFKRDFVCVEDVCDVHEKMLDKHISGIWNVGTGVAVSFQEVAELIAKKYGASIKYIPIPENIKNQYQSFTCANITNLNTVVEKQFLSIKDYIGV